jgi:hypothetical protein
VEDVVAPAVPAAMSKANEAAKKAKKAEEHMNTMVEHTMRSVQQQLETAGLYDSIIENTFEQIKKDIELVVSPLKA